MSFLVPASVDRVETQGGIDIPGFPQDPSKPAGFSADLQVSCSGLVNATHDGPAFRHHACGATITRLRELYVSSSFQKLCPACVGPTNACLHATGTFMISRCPQQL